MAAPIIASMSQGDFMVSVPKTMPTRPVRRRLLGWAATAVAGAVLPPARAAEPVLLGLDGEFSVEGSTSAQAIRAGIEVALDEINGTGGVLGGRPLALVVRDNRTMPARSAQNLREFAAMASLVGVFCGRFSPTVLQAYDATLVIESDDAEHPAVRVPLHGEGAKPVLKVTPQVRLDGDIVRFPACRC